MRRDYELDLARIRALRQIDLFKLNFTCDINNSKHKFILLRLECRPFGDIKHRLPFWSHFEQIHKH